MKKNILLIVLLIFTLIACSPKLHGIYVTFEEDGNFDRAFECTEEFCYGLVNSTLKRHRFEKAKYAIENNIIKFIEINKDGIKKEAFSYTLQDIKNSFGIIKYYKAVKLEKPEQDNVRYHYNERQVFRVSGSNLKTEDRLLLAKRLENEGIAIVNAPLDKSPPKITIIKPYLKEGVTFVENKKIVLIEGKAIDESGIFEVTLNGKEANISDDGNFWIQLKLKVGNNPIFVKAIDINENISVKKFILVRSYLEPASQVVIHSDKSIIEGKYYALIIGVQDYYYSDIHDLVYPLEDAKKVFDVLVRYYTFNNCNVTLLNNPTNTEVSQALMELSRKLGKEDNLFIYYAGHGYWDEKFRQGYWLPSDASWNDRSKWISNSTIRDYIRGIKTQHTLLVSDACFSGVIFKTRKAFIKSDISIQKVYSMPSRKAITSGAFKTVPDKSVFVKYFLKRLTDNQSKYLYSEKLYINMRDAVINNSPNNQTPLFGVIGQTGDEGGDFIFIHR